MTDVELPQARSLTPLIVRAVHELGGQAERYLPVGPAWPESAGLLYMPITLHHDVIANERVSQLTGTAFWHLRDGRSG